MATATLPRPKERRLWTYEEMLAELPETNQPTELWNGEILMAPAPSPGHQSAVLRLAQILDDFVTERDLGQVYLSPVDVVLTTRRVVQPDLLFVAKENLGIVQDRIRGVPDLTVEIVSESSWHRDRIEKKALYEQFGVKEYWLVDPDSRTIEVFALAKGAFRLHSKATAGQTAKSKLLPGFTVSLGQINL